MYPATHFPGTPLRVRRAVRRAMDAAVVSASKRDDWRVALEAIARYESDCRACPPPEDDLRGMMQLSVGMYDAARRQHLIRDIDYCDRKQAVFIAICYIRSQLEGYAGYGGILRLLERHDRGPGDVLRYWQAHPRATYEEMRPYYHGY